MEKKHILLLIKVFENADYISVILRLLCVLTSQFFIKCDVAYHMRFRMFLNGLGILHLDRFLKKIQDKYIFEIKNQKYIVEDIIDQLRNKYYVLFKL